MEDEEFNLLGSIGNAFGGVATAVSNTFDNTIKDPFIEHIGSPIREKATDIQSRSDAVAGNLIIGAVDKASEYIGSDRVKNSFVDKYIPDNIQIAQTGLEVFNDNNPLAGITDLSVGQRIDKFEELGGSLGLGEQIEDLKNNIPMVDEVRTLLNEQSGQDIEAIRSILDETGLGGLLRENEKLIKNDLVTTLLKGVGLEAVPELINAVRDLHELETSDLSDDEAQAVIERMASRLEDVSSRTDQIKKELDLWDSLKGGLKMIDKNVSVVDDAVSALGSDNEARARVIASGAGVLGGALGDNDKMLSESFVNLSEYAPSMYRNFTRMKEDAYEGMSIDQIASMNMKMDLTEDVLKAVLAIAGAKDPATIQQALNELDIDNLVMPDPVTGAPIIKHDTIREYKDVVPKIAGDVLSGQNLSEQSKTGVKSIVGDIGFEALASNPMAMMSIIGTGAFGLGTVGNMLGGGSGPLSALPMLAPVLMRGAMGETYDTAMGGIKDMLSPLYAPIFDAIPQGVKDSPILGSIIGSMEDNPLSVTMGLAGMVTGNDAWTDFGYGTMIADMLFGQSKEQSSVQATGNPLLSPAAVANMNVVNTPVVAGKNRATAESTVGQTQRNPDTNAVLGESLFASREFTNLEVRMIQ